MAFGMPCFSPDALHWKITVPLPSFAPLEADQEAEAFLDEGFGRREARRLPSLCQQIFIDGDGRPHGCASSMS